MGGLLVFGHFLLETVKIELVFDEIFVDFAEEDVILEAAEPLDPSHINVFAELWLLTHV